MPWPKQALGKSLLNTGAVSQCRCPLTSLGVTVLIHTVSPLVELTDIECHSREVKQTAAAKVDLEDVKVFRLRAARHVAGFPVG
jgi:hypothetical protein